MSIHAMINIAKKQLGMEEDDYRAMLADVTDGKRSLKEMDDDEKNAVVARLKSLGFQPKNGRRNYREASQGYHRLVHALWRSVSALDVIEDGSRSALRAFCGRCLHGDDTDILVDPDMLSYAQADKVIKPLRAMERRGKAAAGK
ncbi:regulatory protein GemA [uncultured Tateyamaria sp.]|uniref:regulatory protein GemA n=1 Tax=uncultured Tateyamaria sp. TaxID=455651 RepID=UPI00261AE389|nr:regulatory protein GemA [uncultured Tateyamaria sp.]